jgi:thymidylate synthase
MAIQSTEQSNNSDSKPTVTVTTRHEEYQYLDLIRHIINNGQVRPDRTGTGTIAMFAPPALRFSLANGALPLLTTKRVFLRGVIEELLWFVRGSTDGKLLAEKDIHIWEGNGSRQYLDKVGLGHRREGDLGPVYGFQWRHFGAEYKTCEDDYTGQGVDQLAQVIDKIKNNPTDRRIIMSAWNPKGMSSCFAVAYRFLIHFRHSQTCPRWPFHHATCSANST